MLGGKRTERIGEQIRVELGKLLLTKTKDPRLGFATITRVEMSADLKYAKVHYSVLGDAAAREKTAEALESAHGYLQHEISTVLKLRFTPSLKFYYDESTEYSIQIESIIRKIHEEDAHGGKRADEKESEEK